VDDGHDDTFLNVYPILKAHNITATSYVITTAVDRPGFMNLSQILDLQKAGWEIGSHSCSHQHMTTTSLDQSIHELNDSKKWFYDRGVNATSFAFPYGDENTNLKRIASDSYELTRGTSNDSYSYQKIPKDRFVIGVNLPLKNNLTFSYIDKAIRDKAWIIFYFHRVDATGHVVGTGQDLCEIAEYIDKKVHSGELKAVTVSEGYTQLEIEFNENLQFQAMNIDASFSPIMNFKTTTLTTRNYGIAMH
jgi:peptidoglycan/xylan/chitin deacetylase (PgdA/CDA1 family)